MIEEFPRSAEQPVLLDLKPPGPPDPVEPVLVSTCPTAPPESRLAPGEWPPAVGALDNGTPRRRLVEAGQRGGVGGHAFRVPGAGRSVWQSH